MSLVIRHGGGSHFMRPDGVYRTSVLSPIQGYSPQADVQDVATAFTAPFAPNGLQGLGSFASWWAGIKAKWAAKKAAMFMAAGVHGLGGPPGPAYVNAQQIAPQLQQQMQMLAMIAPNAGGGPVNSIYDAATRRLASYYVAG